MFTIRSNRVSEIKKQFNDRYPFLKLEFFTKPHKAYGTNPPWQISKEDRLLEPTSKTSEVPGITISDDMTVCDLEQLIMDTYGVSVQVFRKSGPVWLETTVTDNWTLSSQNRQGREISNLRR